MGFVTRVEPPGAFDAAIDGWCGEVAQNAPLTLRALKLTTNALTANPSVDQAAAMAAAQAAIAACFASDDYREGARAFMDKRAPRFTGT
jgi:enoyl-CoA hydratase/carnithine racemase